MQIMDYSLLLGVCHLPPPPPPLAAAPLSSVAAVTENFSTSTLPEQQSSLLLHPSSSSTTTTTLGIGGGGDNEAPLQQLAAAAAPTTTPEAARALLRRSLSRRMPSSSILSLPITSDLSLDPPVIIVGNGIGVARSAINSISTTTSVASDGSGGGGGGGSVLVNTSNTSAGGGVGGVTAAAATTSSMMTNNDSGLLAYQNEVIAHAQSFYGTKIEILRDDVTGAVLPPEPELGGAVMGAAPDGTFNGELYYFGIIDILQLYTLRKRGETVFKSIIHPPDDISSVSPAFYAKRFVEFIANHTI